MNKVSVELLKPHEHEGREYQPGHTIHVTPKQAEWLIAIKVGAPAIPEGVSVAPKPFAAAVPKPAA